MFTYYVLNLIAAPGVIMHELSHAFCCILGRVKIFKIKLFRFGDPAGYVEHAEPNGFIASLIISNGPLIFNSLIALMLFSQVTKPFFSLKTILFFWVGVVVGLNSIPSLGDTKVLYKTTKKRIWKNPLVVIGFPIVFFLYVLNFLKRWHVHFIYTGVLFWVASKFLKVY